MTEAAPRDPLQKDSLQTAAVSWISRSRSEAMMKASEKIVSFSTQAPEAEPDGEARKASLQSRDWSSTLDLIREASEAIRISEERAADLEVQVQRITVQATEELRQLEAEIALGQQHLAKAEERARVAEGRANEAEAWLIRLHDAVLGSFNRLPRLTQGRTISGSAETPAARQPAAKP